MEIIFTNTFGFDLESPQPADKHVPEWYKDINSYRYNKRVPDLDVSATSTIKRCMPVFDTITAGYIIVTPVDVYVHPDQRFTWANANFIEFHPLWQAYNHPLSNNAAYPKFSNPWTIKTPKGYSTLFVQPFHRESVFTIFPGIVDTDTYFGNVNFPFVLNDPSFTGYIPKGTPMAQVIPFKRETWKSKLGGEKEKKETEKQLIEAKSTFFDYYKKIWHKKKQYE